MPVGVYLRVSTEEQRERQSIATQREFGEKYCQLHQLDIRHCYADDGVSGTIPLEQRPAGQRILQDARLGRFEQLLVFKLDRLGRDTRLILNAVAELEKYGVRVRSMTEEFDTATATGRLMLTLLSGFAAHERDTIRERSMAGTQRVAETGAWMGGIVPYGYRKVGQKQQARLQISTDPIAGLRLSEADVIRLIYRRSGQQNQSCQRIADHLNRLGVPCAYARDDRRVLRGKRKQRTAGLWRPGRVRNLIVSTTYIGQHQFGKRSHDPGRKIITRPVPAIVDRPLWEKAQQVLHNNYLFSKRNGSNEYLLRGLMKCGLCGLTLSDSQTRRPNGRQEFYYRCNGKQCARGLYGAQAQRCPSKDVNGEFIEGLIWKDIEHFLSQPGEVLERLRQRQQATTGQREHRQKDWEQLQASLRQKTGEREKILSLYRRGRIDDPMLDQQLDEVDKEEAEIQAEIDELTRKLMPGNDPQQLRSAGDLLRALRTRLQGPIAPDLKRRMVETLVGSIRVDTTEEDGSKRITVSVVYRFAGTDSARAHPDLALAQVHREPNDHPEPRTIGDHLRKARRQRRLRQRQIAEQFGVDETTIHNWERGITSPRPRYVPLIRKFLGYDPSPDHSPPTPA